MCLTRRLAALLMLLVLTLSAHAVRVHLRWESVRHPLGIDVANPHLSWQSDTTERIWTETASPTVETTRPSAAFDASARVWNWILTGWRDTSL